jgi:hypothetical protein
MQWRQEKWRTRIRPCQCLCRQGQGSQALHNGQRRQCIEVSRLVVIVVPAGHA